MIESINGHLMLKAFSEFEKYISEYYQNDDYLYTSFDLYDADKRVQTGTLCRFTNNTFLKFIMPQTEEDKTIKIKVVVKGSCLDIEIPDFMECLDADGHIPISYLEDMDIKIVRAIHTLKKILSEAEAKRIKILTEHKNEL